MAFCALFVYTFCVVPSFVRVRGVEVLYTVFIH